MLMADCALNLTTPRRLTLSVSAERVGRPEMKYYRPKAPLLLGLIHYLSYRPVYKMVLGGFKSGITLACRPKTQKVRIFIMAGVGHI